MINSLLVKKYGEPPFNVKEILRYSGCKDADRSVLSLVEECISEIKGKLSYKVCCRKFEIKRTEKGLDLGFAVTDSKGLEKNLEGCGEIILFAATVGLEIDRIIAKYNRISPSKAVIFQAIGAERAEALCDLFNDEIKDEAKRNGKETRPRFSPGYGDLPLSLQTDIFRVLDCPRKIGVTLNESLLMSPSKSVTAIIGITK